MLAYYVEWHLKQKLASLLFEDEEIDDNYQDVIKASRSDSAVAKDRKKRTEDNLPVHSFRTLLEDLGTICLNTVECTLESGKYVFDKITRPTELQQKALDLLSISSICTQKRRVLNSGYPLCSIHSGILSKGKFRYNSFI